MYVATEDLGMKLQVTSLLRMLCLAKRILVNLLGKKLTRDNFWLQNQNLKNDYYKSQLELC